MLVERFVLTEIKTNIIIISSSTVVHYVHI